MRDTFVLSPNARQKAAPTPRGARRAAVARGSWTGDPPDGPAAPATRPLDVLVLVDKEMNTLAELALHEPDWKGWFVSTVYTARQPPAPSSPP